MLSQHKSWMDNTPDEALRKLNILVYSFQCTPRAAVRGPGAFDARSYDAIVEFDPRKP